MSIRQQKVSVNFRLSKGNEEKIGKFRALWKADDDNVIAHFSYFINA
ncbi:MepB family protein [Zooshikella sp. WH53]|uniref:MepB family protein n=1 Tax=Zooshikella harenae TaxID=2827238 RepID=A0ABS5ZAE3_9GAMM|nr:MepB family protein [Zooshikella harenae]